MSIIDLTLFICLQQISEGGMSLRAPNTRMPHDGLTLNRAEDMLPSYFIHRCVYAVCEVRGML